MRHLLLGIVLVTACAEHTNPQAQETCSAESPTICMGNDVYACEDGDATSYSHTCPSDLVCEQGACRTPSTPTPDAPGTPDPDPAACTDSCSSAACAGEWCNNQAGVCDSGTCGACRTDAERACDSADGLLWSLDPNHPECADTSTAADDMSSGECPTGVPNQFFVGSLSPDHVWLFNPTVDGMYTVTVTPEDWNAIVYISRSYCLSPTESICHGYSSKTGLGGVETLTFPAVYMTSYLVVVDGLDTPNGTWKKSGRYRIEVTGPN